MLGGLLARCMGPSLILQNVELGSEGSLYEKFARRLERESIARNPAALADAIMLQSPVRRCILPPFGDDGPNASFLSVRSVYVARVSALIATIPRGWGRRCFGHDLHVIAMLSGPTIVYDEDIDTLRHHLCVSLTAPVMRSALLGCDTPQRLIECLGSGAPA